MKQKTNARFSSRWGFILSAVGSAVGMANVWGFPAKMGSNGGSAFLVAYLFFVVLFSVVGLSAEYAIGRRSKTGTLGSYRQPGLPAASQADCPWPVPCVLPSAMPSSSPMF